MTPSLPQITTNFGTPDGYLVHSSETPAGGSPLRFGVAHLMVLMAIVAGVLVLRASVQSFGDANETGAVGFSPDTGMAPFIAVYGMTAGLLSTAV